MCRTPQLSTCLQRNPNTTKRLTSWPFLLRTFSLLTTLFFYIVNLPVTAQSVQRLATGCTVRGSNPGGTEIFHTRPDRPWNPPSLLHNGYRVYLPGVKWPGRGVDHQPSANTEVKERVTLYIWYPSSRVLAESQQLTTINAILMAFRNFWNYLNVTQA